MDTQKKLSFFEKIYLSISDFRFYPYILKTEKLKDSYKYFLKLILLLTLIITAYSSSTLFSVMDAITSNFDEDDPYKKQTVETNLGNFEIAFPNEYSADELKIIVNEYNSEGKTIFKIITFVIMYSIVFIVFLIMKMITVSFISTLVAVLCLFFKMKTNTQNYYKLAIYSLTLSFIVETASIVLVGGIKDYTIVSESLLSIVYIFYAVRAIKLDAFLLIMKNGNTKNKSDEEFRDIEKELEDDEETNQDTNEGVSEEEIKHDEEEKK